MINLYLQRLPAALYHHGRDDDTAGHTHHVCPPAHGVHPGDDDDGDDDGDYDGDDDGDNEDEIVMIMMAINMIVLESFLSRL